MEFHENSNSTNSSSTSFSLYSDNILIFTVVFSIQFVFAVVENLLIVWIVYKDKRLKTTTNYLVANMAVSDVLAAVCVFPLRLIWINFDKKWLVGGIIGQLLCKLSNFTAELSLTVSVYSCFFIAIDRYFAVAHPIKKPFQPKIKFIIALTWILSSFFKAPIFYFYDIIVEDNQKICLVSSNISSSFSVYFYVNNVLTFGVTIIVVTIIYVLIVYKLHKHKVPGFQNNSTIRRKELQNRKVLKLSVTIVALFYISWGSRSIIAILNDTGNFDHLSQEANFNLTSISFFMLYMSLVYNFFVYLFFNSVYRQNFKDMITKCCFSDTISNIMEYSLRQSSTGNREKVSESAVVQMKNIQERCSI